MERIKLIAVDVGTPSPHYETVAEYILEPTEFPLPERDPIWMTKELKESFHATKLYVIKDAKVPLPNGASLSVYASYSLTGESEASCQIWIEQEGRKILEVDNRLNVSGNLGTCNPNITMYLDEGIRINVFINKEIIADV